jgi:hypothetical protein
METKAALTAAAREAVLRRVCNPNISQPLSIVVTVAGQYMSDPGTGN